MRGLSRLGWLQAILAESACLERERTAPTEEAGTGSAALPTQANRTITAVRAHFIQQSPGQPQTELSPKYSIGGR